MLRDKGKYSDSEEVWPVKGYEKPSAALLYLLLICVAYAPVVFSGRSLHASLYYPYGVLNDGPVGYEGRKPLNTFNIDHTHAFTAWPLNKAVGDMYRKGEIPLWNPYQGIGMPLAAQITQEAFFPYRVLEDVSPVWTWDYFLLGRLWIAGFFTFLFLRQLGLSCMASLLGGIFYMFSGAFVWHINREDIADTAITVPILLLSLERLMQRQLYKEIAFSAGAFGVVLSTQPEATPWILLLGFCYILVKGIAAGINMKTLILLLTVPFLLGMGISAILWWPFLDMALCSQTLHLEGWMGTVGTNQAWSYKLSILFPTIFILPSWTRICPQNGCWDYLGGYTGVLPIYLTVLGLILVFVSKERSFRRELIFFAGFAVAVLLKNFGIPPFIWLGHLPIFNASFSQRWGGCVWTFSFAVAAAIGLEVLNRSSQNSSTGLQEVSRRLLGSLWKKVLFFGLTVGILIAIRKELLDITKKEGPHDSFFAPSVFGGCVLASIVVVFATLLVWRYSRNHKGLAAFIPLAFVELWYVIPRGYNYYTMNQLWIPVVMGLLVIVFVALERRRLAVLGSFVFILSYLVIDAYAPNGFPDRHDPFTEAPYVGYLKKLGGNYRVIGEDGILMANFASALGVQDVHYAFTVIPQWFCDYAEKSLFTAKPGKTAASSWFLGVGGQYPTMSFPEVSPGLVSDEVKRALDNAHRVEREIRVNLPFYSLLGLKYIILPKRTTFNTHDLRDKSKAIFPLIYHDEVNIYENPEVFPRAFVVHGVRYADSYEEAQALSRGLGFDLRRTVVLEDALPAEYENGTQQEGLDSTAIIRQYKPNKVVIDVHADAPGVLVLSDLYYPGWEVYVDREPARLYRADGVIRGVFVREGEHTVVLKYVPRSFKYGLMALALSLTVCGGFIMVGSRKFV